MPINIEHLFFIGNFTDADTNEGDFDTENDPFSGSVISGPTLQLLPLSLNDVNGDGFYADDENRNEAVTYDLNGTSVTTQTDSTIFASVTVLLGDGSSFTVNTLIIQMTNGDSFIGELIAGSLDNQNIQQVTVNNIVNSNFSGWFSEDITNTGIVCFTRNTLIKTSRGEVPIQDLTIGDEVVTLDNGLQSIRWIWSSLLDANDLRLDPNLRPIRFHAGVLGEGLPKTDLSVSPQHRVFVRSNIAKKMCGTDEILIPAKKLTQLDGVEIDHQVQKVEYFHFMFDCHELVYSNGALSESLLTGREALRAMKLDELTEIRKLFPKIGLRDLENAPARYILEKGKRIGRFLSRHQKNFKPLYVAYSNPSLTRARGL